MLKWPKKGGPWRNTVFWTIFSLLGSTRRQKWLFYVFCLFVFCFFWGWGCYGNALSWGVRWSCFVHPGGLGPGGAVCGSSEKLFIEQSLHPFPGCTSHHCVSDGSSTCKLQESSTGSDHSTFGHSQHFHSEMKTKVNIARGTTDPKIDSVTWTKLGNNIAPFALNLQIWPSDGATCISRKFGHQTAPLALGNLTTRWHQLH